MFVDEGYQRQMDLYDPEQPDFQVLNKKRPNHKKTSLFSGIICILALMGLLMLVPLVVDYSERQNLINEFSNLNQESQNKTYASMKVKVM